MTRPYNPDRDLPDPGDDHSTTCDACGGPSPHQRTCDECHWGPQGDDTGGDDEPDDAGEP